MSNSKDGLRAWTIEDSTETYQIQNWGGSYFSISDAGQVLAHPEGPDSHSISLLQIVEDVRKRGYSPPVLIRFSDILSNRISSLSAAFSAAIGVENYTGRYRPVFPIKVNQQRDVVEELVEFGAPHSLGLEAGSKPELLVALAYIEDDERLIVCNGYKDRAYVETALLGQKLGRYPILVIDRYEELATILEVSRRLGLEPNLGVRVRLNAKGAGKWVESGGARSKFGLSADELVRMVKVLEDEGMAHCLQLLHFHIGSQITAIRSIKYALREAARVYVELHRLGAGLRFIDVGGGLAVDYDGSKSSFHSSTNYTLEEYANDVVWTIRAICNEKGIPHPDIVSESGRALVAHHSVLVFDVLGRHSQPTEPPGEEAENHECQAIRSLHYTWTHVGRKNLQESYHDAILLKDEALSLFDHGILDLEGRAFAERMFWAICHKVRNLVGELEYVPEDLQGLEKALSDTAYCNFSVFQSTPDHWAVKQLFPIMPIHRLNEEPKRSSVLADLTCDSDGKVDQFIDFHDVKQSLPLHAPRPGKPYYLAVFLVGAYQETLGDLHNLFGDTHVVHVKHDEEHGYIVDRLIEGNSVTEVLDAVRYDRRAIMSRVRHSAELAVRRGGLSLEESALLLRRYEESLSGYTYLSGAESVDERQSAAESGAGAARR